MDTKKWIGMSVTHVTFGEGTVTKLVDAHLSVCFLNGKEKSFLYPDAFEKFLSVNDAQLTKEIASDLKQRQKDADYIRRTQTEASYERIKAFAQMKKEEQERKERIKQEKQRQIQKMREQRNQTFLTK